MMGEVVVSLGLGEIFCFSGVWERSVAVFAVRFIRLWETRGKPEDEPEQKRKLLQLCSKIKTPGSKNVDQLGLPSMNWALRLIFSTP